MFMDLGAGALISVLFIDKSGIDFNVLIVIAGAVFAVLPDIDVPFELLKRKKLGGTEHGVHRTYSHYPILYFPLCFLVWLLWGSFWAVLLASCLLFHILHDSFGMGWGLKLMWPFSQKHYKFFADQKDGSWSTNFVSSWDKKEFTEIAKRYGDDKWFHNYINFSPTLVFESLVFIVAIIFIALKMFNK